MPGILCEHCTATCCTYIALPIDKPETRADFEDVRWFLIHERVSVFVEDGDWYVLFQTTCRHLQRDNRCGIYATRPKVCRDYSTENCDYHSGDYGWEHHFTNPEHLDTYIRDPARNERSSRGVAGKTRRAKLRAAIRLPRGGGTDQGERDRRGIALPVLPAAVSDRGCSGGVSGGGPRNTT